MGLMQREKGKRFERAIAAELRTRWPAAIVRRASQAERADNPDVFAEGAPALTRLWLELQDARQPTPALKLAQAERDAAAWQARRAGSARWPVVVWHRLGERTTWATLRLGTLLAVTGSTSPAQAVVTLELGAFLDLLAAEVSP